MTDDLQSKVKIIYQYLYEKCSGHRFDNFKYLKNDQTIIDRFIKRLNYSIGDDWIWEYFCYQFNRYVDLNTRIGKGKIPVSWVMGSKAIEKYKNVTEEELFYVNDFKVRFNLKNPVLETVKLSYNGNYKDNERKRFKNVERQFIHCKENNLFDELNKICFSCKNKKYCEL